MGGSLCITTNTISTFNELFKIFDKVLDKMNLVENKSHLQKYISNRSTKYSIVNEFEEVGFKLKYSITDFTQMRFVCARAVFDHSLIRIGFFEYWKKIIPKNKMDVFFKNVETQIDLLIKEKGEFKLCIPIQYFEFIKTPTIV